jgi:hypothetical protein
MSDKRSVHTDALDTLGSIIDDTAKRDAIHLAVEPCIAGELLSPGDDIGLLANNLALKNTPSSHEIDMTYLGIVDPFLEQDVKPGEKFWMILYPRTITSLRHVWTHPHFSDAIPEKAPKDKQKSIEWLKEYSRNLGVSYNNMLNLAIHHSDDEYVYTGEEELHDEIPPEFWDHIEIITGKKMIHRPTHFTCSC